ncbi:MAG TPA: chromosome segregation protein SMC [Thermoanaerobaculia bacterium]|nr:chromosome segregation protein SMC [Thermoanaerobaculia bacterium]
MLRLERVEISGFKSFYEKVDLAFPGRVTAVVGPNGCGKSNICDAVAWALGEQSARILRGERMDDVIFNGSAKRRPLGMAEVIVTLAPEKSNGNGNGDGESERLRVGRRVFRDGEGEYFLNDKQVRFKDVQDRLLGTGLSVRAYSVIEQGRIDQVLSTKPQDRRRLIEEAAGITRYKTKRRLAEVKLEETRANLLRISDIVSEVERNCASLKRQASRAARHKEMSASLRVRRAALARIRSDVMVEALAAAERLRDERRDAEAAAAAALGHAEATLAASRIAAADTAGERDRLREILATLEAAIARDDERLEANRRSSSDLAARRSASEREGLDFAGEEARTARQLSELEARLERAVAEARNRSLAREESDRRAAEAAAALAVIEAELERAREQTLRATGERVAARNARHDLELAAERIAAGVNRIDESLAKLAGELAERRSEIDAAERDQNALAARAAAAEETVRRLFDETGALARSIAETEAARESARASLAALEERASALAEALRAREDKLASLARALSGAGLESEGTFSRRLNPAPGWEHAVDVVLGGDLDALLARGDWKGAAAASRELPAPRLLRADWQLFPPAVASIEGTLGGWEIALSNFGTLTAAERSALPPVAFVASLDIALSLAESSPEALFVTRDGDVVRGPLLRLAGTRARTSGAFALERELAEIRKKTDAIRASIVAMEVSRTNVESARIAKERELSDARETEGRTQSELSASSARLDERRAAASRLAREAETFSAEREGLAGDASALEARRRGIEEEERRWERAEIEGRERADSLSASQPEARAAATAAAEELAHRRTEAEVAAERRRSVETAMAALHDSQQLFQRRAREANEEMERIAVRALELSRDDEQTRGRRETNVVARDMRASELQVAARLAEEAALRAAQAEEIARTARVVLDTAREGRFEAEVTATRASSDLEHLVTQAREEFGTAPGELEPPADRSDEALARLDVEAAELAASLERLGPVNLLAWEEHKTESERLTFLTTQRDDLVRSVAELQDSIRKINATSAERFAQAFAAINANFTAVFTRLFRGGTAEMRLLDENDPLESGVEIIAQPPGKRNQSILLLSGGEKALTAISLLMAIFRYRPSPFCILDEVDAPLDEANIDRFTRLLREMTEETQFIAITHNKRTMETADSMYGVTMEEPGCSKVVSVRFD